MSTPLSVVSVGRSQGISHQAHPCKAAITRQRGRSLRAERLAPHHSQQSIAPPAQSSQASLVKRPDLPRPHPSDRIARSASQDPSAEAEVDHIAKLIGMKLLHGRAVHKRACINASIGLRGNGSELISPFVVRPEKYDLAFTSYGSSILRLRSPRKTVFNSKARARFDRHINYAFCLGILHSVEALFGIGSKWGGPLGHGSIL